MSSDWNLFLLAGVSNQAGLPQVPLPEIVSTTITHQTVTNPPLASPLLASLLTLAPGQVRAAAGVHAGGGRRVHVPVRGPVRPPVRRK
jgi:hypothetical protein